MAVQKVLIPYTPRDQFEAYHDRTERFAKVVAHRRFGKTVGCVNDLIRAALTNTREYPPPRYSYVAPTYTQAKDIAWGYLKHYSAPVPGIKSSESELFVEYPHGARVRLYGADNYERLRGLYNDGVVIDEPAQMDPRAWPEVIRPTLSDYSGWASFIGTPAGRDWFFKIDKDEKGDLLPDFFRLTIKASESGVINAEELESLRAGMSAEQFAQEFECSFDAAVIGAYYGRLMAAADADKRITGVPHEPAAQVWTAWDLGIRDATAIWFCQVVGREIRLIDYYEASGADLGHYVQEIGRRSYVYAGHIVPHDAQAKELGTGKSRLEVLESLGLRNLSIAPMHRVEDGINAVRVMIPKCWFDAGKCARGIDALKLYRAEFDDKLQALKPRPVHDWCFTGDTKILTRYGIYPIKELPNQGEVLTPCGWKPYHSPRLTRTSAPLVEVQFVGGHSVRCTPDHMFLTASGWKSAESLTRGTPIQSSLTYSRSISMAVYIACGLVRDIFRAAAKNCTGMFGLALLAPSLAGVTSTTGTLTRPTTDWIIWSVSHRANIFRLHGRRGEKSAQSAGTLRKKLGKLPLIGTSLRLVGFGIDATHCAPRVGQSGSAKIGLAISVVLCSARWFARAAIARNIAALNARSLRIERVVNLDYCEDVYCITVPGEESFSLANGAVVHNCSHAADAFRYLAMTLDRVAVSKGFSRQIVYPKSGVA